MNICAICGIPQDAGFFDESNIKEAPKLGEELVLARYELHRNYCGMLMYFAQFTNKYASDPTEVQTPGYQWQIRCNGQPRDPYLAFQHIINPWGLSGFPVYLRLEEGCVLEITIRNLDVLNPPPPTDPNAEDKDKYRRLKRVGGRILGRYWYNNIYGGLPNRL
jgi:hypothetical protein